MQHGSLHEAWFRCRELPFIVIAPQLPMFAQHDQVRLRDGIPLPERLTVQEDLRHNHWTRTGASEDLYQWSLAHLRPQSRLKT